MATGVKKRKIKAERNQALIAAPITGWPGMQWRSVLAVMKIQGNQIIAASKYHCEM